MPCTSTRLAALLLIVPLCLIGVAVAQAKPDTAVFVTWTPPAATTPTEEARGLEDAARELREAVASRAAKDGADKLLKGIARHRISNPSSLIAHPRIPHPHPESLI